MLIDWFTVTAQVINFLILIALLKRFLYQPILNALDAREQHIAKELNDASNKKQRAEDIFDDYVNKNTLFEQQRTERFAQLTQEINTQRTELLTKMQAQVKAQRDRQTNALKNEQANLKQTLVLRTQHEVFAIARKVLAEIANDTLETQITRLFIEHLISSDEPLFDTFTALEQPMVIKTAFVLPAEQKSRLTKALKARFNNNSLVIQYVDDSELLCGIELAAQGYKIAWSIEEYLNAMVKNIEQGLSQTTSHHKPSNNADVSASEKKSNEPHT